MEDQDKQKNLDLKTTAILITDGVVTTDEIVGRLQKSSTIVLTHDTTVN